MNPDGPLASFLGESSPQGGRAVTMKSFWGMILVGFLVVVRMRVASGKAVPIGEREDSNRRACIAHQKGLIAAVEMY